MSNTKVQNLDSVTFGNAIIETTGHYGWDGSAPDEHKRDITFIFHLTDKVKKLLVDRLAASLRIKGNQKDEPRLKGHPEVTSYSEYAELIDKLGGEVEWTEEQLIQWLQPTKRTLTPYEKYMGSIKEMLDAGQIDRDKYEQLKELAPEQEV